MTPGPRFHQALSFASLLHHEQRRKGGNGSPYVGHLLGTCAIVLENGGSEDEAIAALLHDAVEDQGGMETAARIRTAFGDEVTRIVLACSDATTVPKPPWRARKANYHAHLNAADASVLLVSAADKLDNVRSIRRALDREGEGYWDVFTAPKRDSIWNYRTLVDIYRARGDERVRRLVPELGAIVDGFEGGS